MYEKCPNCGSHNLRRSRVRPGERTISMFFLVPVHCRECKERFWVKYTNAYFVAALSTICLLIVGYSVWLAFSAEQGHLEIKPLESNPLIVDDGTDAFPREDVEDIVENELFASPNDKDTQFADTNVYSPKEPKANFSDKRFFAIQLYLENAQNGKADAQYQLGLLYLTGNGALQDFEESSKWFKQAAEQNHAHAQYELGLLYHHGRGVELDQERSYMWLNLAAAAGVDQAILARNKVSKTINTRQLMAAQKAAREWLLEYDNRVGAKHSEEKRSNALKE